MKMPLLELMPGLAAAAPILGALPVIDDLSPDDPHDPPPDGGHRVKERDCKAA
jgi:hypothetical protein